MVSSATERCILKIAITKIKNQQNPGKQPKEKSFLVNLLAVDLQVF